MLKFIIGGAGSGKSTMLMEDIKTDTQNGKKVIVIVPEQFSFDSDKKLYKKLGCVEFNKIISKSFTTISDLIFEKYGSRSGEYADDMTKVILMKKTIKKLTEEKQFRFFARHALKPDFVGEALELVTEFRQSGVSADDFTAKMTGSDATFSDKISDLALIYYTYDKMLLESGLKDSLTNISEAAAIAEINSFFKNTNVYFDEFESFTGDEYPLIEAIISQAEKVCISLRLESDEKRADVFNSVQNTKNHFSQIASNYGKPVETIKLDKPVKYKGEDLTHLNMNIFCPIREVYGKSENVRIIECPDLYEEADWVCSEIVKLVREKGYSYRQISVMSRQLGDYTYILDSAFEKYNIPFSLDVKKSVMHTSIMQYISSIVETISQKQFSTDLIFKYAKTNLSGLSVASVSELENYCFEWDVEGKRWLEPFKTDKVYQHVEETRLKIIEPLKELRERCLKSDCKGICRAIFEFISKMEVQKRVGGIINEFKSDNLNYLAKEFKRIWDMMIEILESLADIGGEMSIEDFKDVFLMMIRQITYSVPPQTLDGVRISHAETARPDNPSVLFILGVNEGYFPADVTQSGLLNEKDRLMFEQSGINLSRTNEELISDEKLIVYKTLTHACEKLYITYPLADSSGGHRYPATVLKQLTSMYGKDIVKLSSEKNLIDYCATKKAAYFNLVRGFSDNSDEIASIREVLESDVEYKHKLEVLESIANNENIWKITDTNIMERLYTKRLNISATAIEDYNKCHFMYFCKTGLNLRVRKKRAVDRISEGNLTHKCLEVILGSCSSKKKFDNLDDEKINNMIDGCAGKFIEEAFGSEVSSMLSVPDVIKRISVNIRELVHHLQAELGQSEFRPVAFELDVRHKDGKPILKTENGIEVHLCGYVDRVDVFEANDKKFLRVVDYKTGDKVFSISSLLYGINMQMLIYLFSITGEEGCFKNYAPAGVLYMPSKGAGCTRKRDDSVSVESYLESHYKMNGVVLKDREILNAMEKEIKGVYIPASLLKSDKGVGELSLSKASSCLTAEHFKKLREYTDSILLKMCDELYGGDISADPYVTKSKTPCKYCDYWTICGNVPTSIFHEEAEDAEEIMMRKLEGDDDDKVE